MNQQIPKLIFVGLVSLPFFIGGAYVASDDEFVVWQGLAIVAVGLILSLSGTYLVLSRGVGELHLVAGERIVITRHPSLKPPTARVIASTPLLLAAWIIFGFTQLPYVYPFLILIFGLHMYFRGAYRFWINTRTGYYVTGSRIVEQYKFFTLRTKEIPVARIISISEKRNLFEMLTKRGTVVVSSGIGMHQTIHMADVDDPTPFANTLRDSLTSIGE